MVIGRWQVPLQWKLLPVFLLGAALRLVGTNNVSPPGLEHDEVANWLIDRAILAGQHAIYFTEAYGHEAGFHYVQAGFVALLGDNALALRLPAAFMGLLGVAVTFALARLLFGPRVALTSAALLAVLFFPVFYSRLALRAIMLPLLAGLSACFWWRAWGMEERDWRLEIGDWGVEAGRPDKRLVAPEKAIRNFALAGVFAGLSLHTYMAARAVPIFYFLFLAALALLRPRALRARWRQLLVFWLALVAAAAPLAIYLLTNPGAEFRISEVDAPLRALRQGNLHPVVDNAVDILGAFGIAGDPLWRQNVAHMPIFEPLLATLFYACLALLLLYVRDVRYLFLILWLLTATIPSIVTIDAPSSIRMINILPVLTILPAIVMHNLGHLSTKNRWLSTAPVDKWLVPLLVAGIVLLHTARTARAIFVTWPANEEVQFVWQEALTDAAGYLDRAPQVRDVAVGGWTPASMDPPTMELTLRRDDLSLRFFDPQQSLLLPAPTAGERATIIRPAILPFDPALRPPLHASGIVSETRGSFIHYTLASTPQLAPQVPSDVVFGGELAFLGYTPSRACTQGEGDAHCTIVSYWRVLQSPSGERQLFLHIVDGQGAVLGTGDALGAPSGYWRSGDVLLQKHVLAPDLLHDYEALHLGVYDPLGGQRLATPTGQEYERLLPATVP